jgi:hypothetical protein
MLFADDSSSITVSGGTINDNIFANGQGQIILWGADFAVDGTPVGYGTLTSIFGGDLGYDPARILTGTLANGDPIDVLFRLGDSSSIVLVPEPTTLLLLGFGGLALLRKRR